MRKTRKDAKNFIGQRFGRLVVIKHYDRVGVARWTCKCDCGEEKIVWQCSLVTGKTTSCGCLAREISAQRRKDAAIPQHKRVLRNITITKTGCWQWYGALDKNGYGRIDSSFTHRVIYEHYNGKTDLYVLHKCDNPKCCNPDHLFAGTAKENTQDMMKKGRMKVGSALPQSKITETDVKQMRKMYNNGTTQAEIARIYKIKQPTVSEIVNMKKWKHVK